MWVYLYIVRFGLYNKHTLPQIQVILIVKHFKIYSVNSEHDNQTAKMIITTLTKQSTQSDYINMPTIQIDKSQD